MATAPPTTTRPEPTADAALLVGEMVHYRHRDHCWAAAIVDSGPEQSAQLYLLPLPPSFPMPAAPGTFVNHDDGRGEDTWHRLDECAAATRPRRRRTRRKTNGAD
ncbi:MAG TPA: hypothetical protein VM253_04350 [Candidatus Limnocylindrales bacterium]|nr:hypothetical protein [Candidatus Limnocylindrales bacterium]